MLSKEYVLPARYTCDGQDISPPLHWEGIPAGTKELMLAILNLEPVNEKLYFDWAVAGLKPTSTGLAEGRLPSGAILGTNSAGKRGYHLCPTTSERYLAVLYALPHPLAAKAGFEPIFTRKRAVRDAIYSGHLFFAYKRR